MSLIPGFTTKAPTGQMPGVVCGPRQCDEIELIAAPIYSTKTLKIFETLLTVTVVGVSGFLLLILLRGTRRFTTPFFRMLTLLVAVIVTHAIVSIAFKLTTLWFGVLLNPKNVVSLVADLLSKYLSIILIFLLALNRFAIIVYPFLDTLLFAQYRYILLCVLCFALSSGVTYVVIDLSRLRREFIPEIGFVDFIDYPVSYEVSCIAFLVVAFISVCLHLVIVVYLRCSHSKPSSISTTKVQKRMFREIVLMTVTNAVFSLFFILISQMSTSYESRMAIISIYNILCFIPDILIPVFILIGSKEVHAEIASRLSCVRHVKVRRQTNLTVTLSMKN